MADEALRPIYLLAGSDRSKVKRALQRLKARFVEESVEVVSAATTSGGDAAAACNALGLFAGDGGRLVVVEDAESWGADDVQALAAYLEDPVPGAVLAVVAGELSKGSALPDLCSGADQVLVYNVPKPRDLPGWVRSQLERLGAKIEPDAARLLVELVGDDVIALGTEAEKLAAWAGGETIGVRQVEALAVHGREAAAWALSDAWGAHDVGAVLKYCEAELERERSFVVASRLAAHVARVRAVQTLGEEGLSSPEIAKRLRIHEFSARKALAHAGDYSRDELDAAVVRLAALDAALKGGSRLPAELELERALVDVTRRAEPALSRD